MAAMTVPPTAPTATLAMREKAAQGVAVRGEARRRACLVL